MNAAPSLSAAPRARAPLRYFDAHNHLQDEWLAPHLDRALAELERLPIGAAVVNGTCADDWPRVAELARAHAWVRPSYGLHPWLAGSRRERWFDRLEQCLRADPGAELGEIGVDRWILDSARPDDPRLQGLARASLDEQFAVFVQQLQLGATLNRVATIHCIDAWGALWAWAKSAELPARGFLLHAYGGSVEMVQGWLDRGAYFSFNGYFLGERKQRQQEVFRHIPLERVLMETDAPSMPLPQAWRTYKLPPGPSGIAINHPANLEAVYAGFAALRGISVIELGHVVEENFRRLFGDGVSRGQ